MGCFCFMDLKFDLRQLFRKGKIVDKRLYLDLKDICKHIIVGSPSESSGTVKIVSATAAGATISDGEILSALGDGACFGVVSDTTNSKKYFVVSDGSTVNKIEL